MTVLAAAPPGCFSGFPCRLRGPVLEARHHLKKREALSQEAPLPPRTKLACTTRYQTSSETWSHKGPKRISFSLYDKSCPAHRIGSTLQHFEDDLGKLSRRPPAPSL